MPAALSVLLGRHNPIGFAGMVGALETFRSLLLACDRKDWAHIGGHRSLDRCLDLSSCPKGLSLNFLHGFLGGRGFDVVAAKVVNSYLLGNHIEIVVVP
jgi:hypothetical protein